MGAVRDAVRALASNAQITRSEAQQLISQIQADHTVSAEEKAELTQALARFADAFDADAWQLMQDNAAALGVSVGAQPAVDLSNRPELADVASGKKGISTTKNSRDPAVATLQRALMALARLTGKTAYGLPSGADGAYGNEAAKAIKAFQADQGLTPDGAIGPRTLAALQAALASAAGGASTGGGTPAAAPLTNARFLNDATLEAVANGAMTLQSGAKGATVTTLQQALLDLGYTFPKYGADGGFGGEMKRAVTQFQKDRGLPATGKVDRATLQAMDRAAPAAGAKAVLFPEYDKLFADGVLDVTLGVGFDEDGSDLIERKKVQDGLAARGFSALDVASKSDADLRALGLDPAKLDRQGTYFLKSGSVGGKPVKVLVKYVDRDTPDAKARFGAGLASSELVMYGGHARYGSGPDFDTMDSAAGNFVLGVNAQGHKTGALTPAYSDHIRTVLKDAGNDLEKAHLTDSYQLMFFSGCTTLNYLDELRGIPANKSESNLDVVVSNDPLYWNHMADNLFTMLDGVLAKQSENDITAGLVQVNDGVPFTADGFGGNAYRPS